MIKILLVEKNIIFSNYLKGVFDQDEKLHLVCTCAEGSQALDFLKTQTVDLVLIDFLQTNGLVVTQEIKSKYPKVRIIGFSTYEEGEYKNRMIELGAEKCLSKYKITINELLLEIKNYCSIT